MSVKITLTFDYPEEDFRDWMQVYLDDGQSEQEAAENALETMINDMGLYDMLDVCDNTKVISLEYTPEVYK